MTILKFDGIHRLGKNNAGETNNSLNLAKLVKHITTTTTKTFQNKSHSRVCPKYNFQQKLIDIQDKIVTCPTLKIKSM